MFSDTSDSAEIAFVTAPAMAPSSRLIVYQILPDNEVAADYISFDVSGGYPMETSIRTSADEARPGEPVEIELVTQGRARVGLAAVDRSVFILAENRLNLQQVFAELERLYMQPQVEAAHRRSGLAAVHRHTRREGDVRGRRTGNHDEQDRA